MYSEFGLELALAQQGVLNLRRIDAKTESLRRERITLADNLAGLEKLLDKEDKDLERIENKGLSHLFYSVLGRLDEKIDKEQREAFAARLKYDQAVTDLSGVEKELGDLASERVQYTDCEQKYADLYEQKKAQLLQSGSETAMKIVSATAKLQAVRNNVREIREAITAGMASQDSLNEVLRSLGKAEGWGTWDLMGGGLLCDLAKHSDIDDAQTEARQAQYLLRQFRTELVDVRIDSDLQVEVGSFAKFADFFFDGLFADWCMQSKIHDSQANVESVEKQVEDVILRLRLLAENETAVIMKLEKEIENLVLDA
ncbi:MAG: hypothetical protein WCG21_05910 [Eubacteriales bacterium]